MRGVFFTVVRVLSAWIDRGSQPSSGSLRGNHQYRSGHKPSPPDSPFLAARRAVVGIRSLWMCGIVMTVCAADVGYLDRGSLGADLPGWLSREPLGSKWRCYQCSRRTSPHHRRVNRTRRPSVYWWTLPIYAQSAVCRHPHCGWWIHSSDESVRFAMLAVGSALWSLLLPFAEEL